MSLFKHGFTKEQKLMVRSITCLFFLVILGLKYSTLSAQDFKTEEAIMLNDNLAVSGDTVKLSSADSLQFAKNVNQQATLLNKTAFSPNPKKAVVYAVIFPGLGQIYNRKYWKLPIIYGGFLGVAYAISWNGGMYSDYKTAYKDIVLDPENTTSWHHFVSNPQEVLNSPTLLKQYQDRFKRRKDTFRRNRDLAIIVGVGLYALSIIDAYVDASLYNFNISPDLSMTVSPLLDVAPRGDVKSSALGLQCQLTF